MLPNFLIIGAPKCGTTSLYHYLNQHPDIFMSPKKEPHYFAYSDFPHLDFSGKYDNKIARELFVIDRIKYENLFKDAKENQLKGEASACYLYNETAPRMIEKVKYDNIKLIAILRNPIERAYSNYLHLVRDGWEKESFAGALISEWKRIKKNYLPVWHYEQLGYYSKQLDRYFRLFNKSQIKIILFEDFKNKTEETMWDICSFLEIDNNFQFDLSQKYNKTGIHKSFLNAWLYKFLIKPSFWKYYLRLFPYSEIINREIQNYITKKLDRPEMSIIEKNYLRESYRKSIYELENILDRDLEYWLE